MGERLEPLAKLLDHTVNRPKVAMIFDWENWWALEDVSGPRMDLNYVDAIFDYYQPLWEAGVDVDLVGMEDSLEDYQLVLAPLNYMYKEGYPKKVRKFVADGGVYVTTYFSGLVDESDLCFLGNHPLEDVLGIEQEEIDAPMEEFPNSFPLSGNRLFSRRAAGGHPCERWL